MRSRSMTSSLVSFFPVASKASPVLSEYFLCTIPTTGTSIVNITFSVLPFRVTSLGLVSTTIFP
jgi:hypothetical protein